MEGKNEPGKVILQIIMTYLISALNCGVEAGRDKWYMVASDYSKKSIHQYI